MKYLFVEPNKIPIVKETVNVSMSLNEIFGRDRYTVLHTMAVHSDKQNVSVIGYPLDIKGHDDNRLLYGSPNYRSIGGVIQGNFVLVGIDGDRYVSLNEHQISILKRLYGRRSIEETKECLRP